MKDEKQYLLSNIELSEYGEECTNCECWSCMRNDINICQNCDKCNGNVSYNRWMMECDEYSECKYPEILS